MSDLTKRIDEIIEDIYGIEDELDIDNVVAELREIKEGLFLIEEVDE